MQDEIKGIHRSKGPLQILGIPLSALEYFIPQVTLLTFRCETFWEVWNGCKALMSQLDLLLPMGKPAKKAEHAPLVGWGGTGTQFPAA